MRYARGEAILRVIAMRYAPQLIVSQNEGVLLANLFPRDTVAGEASDSPYSWTFHNGIYAAQFRHFGVDQQYPHVIRAVSVRRPWSQCIDNGTGNRKILGMIGPYLSMNQAISPPLPSRKYHNRLKVRDCLRPKIKLGEGSLAAPRGDGISLSQNAFDLVRLFL